MIGGPSPLAAHGAHSTPHDLRPPNIPEFNFNRIDALEQRFENGNLDVDKLQVRLGERFGEAAKGIVGEDGTVDFEKLAALVSAERSAELKERLETRFGEAADGIVGEDGTVDREKLQSLIVDQHVTRLQEKAEAGELDTEEFQAHLERRFGEEAEGIVADDGAIDFEALRTLLEKNEPFFMLVGGPFTDGGGRIAYALPAQSLIDFEA